MQKSVFKLRVIQPYIHVNIIIPVTLPLAISFTNSFTEVGKRLDLFRVIIDIRGSASKSSVCDKYDFAYNQAKLAGLTHNWQIALLKNTNNNSLEFLESVMCNAGYQFKLFENEQTAIDWFSLT